MLVNFQAQAVTCAVKKSYAPATANFSRETTAGEKFLDSFMNCHSVDASLDSCQGQCLPGFYCVPTFSLRLACASAQHRPRHVAKISGLRVTRKNIQNNQRICVQRPKAALVRVASLIATCDNRAVRISPRAQDRGVDFSSEDFGSQRPAVPAQSFAGAGLGRFQNFNRAFESFFGDAQSMSHQFDFLLRLRFPLVPEKSVRRPHTDIISREFLRITKRKIRGNSRRFYTAFFEKIGKNLFVLWRSLLRSLYFALKLTEHHEFIRFRLFSAAIDF